ncbi:MAG: matrixin family metalloprotease [Planctomycetota bacterium]|jgi:hypothetical protein
MRRNKWIVLGLAACVAVGAFCARAAWAKGEGKGKDRVLSKVTFIHFKKGHAKPPWAGGDGGEGKKQDEGDYTFISRGARWKSTEEFRLNLTADENTGGVLDGVITDAVAAGMAEWESPEGASLDIFGALVIDSSASYDDGAYRGHNTISFGSYGDPAVIGVTSVWGYFSGPPRGREILEAHILLNDQFGWGDASADTDGDGEPDAHLMDIQNIATHELGHVAGMGDLYESGASKETMYGYSEEGEMKKRDLYTGDMTGIKELYQ